MDAEFVHTYFEKAVALVLSSAGIASVEKQALHLLAAEAERYAYSLGLQAGKLAEASRRSECTVADIQAAAACLTQTNAATSSSIFVNPEQKRKLRISVENLPLRVSTNLEPIRMPQLEHTSVDVAMLLDDTPGLASPSKGKKSQIFPEWLQRQIELNHTATRDATKSSGRSERATSRQASGPLSRISSLILAEAESRQILTKKLKITSISAGTESNS